MNHETVLLALLTALLVPWIAWSSNVLISIRVQLARGEENFDRLKDALDDHERRLRVLESQTSGPRKTDKP